MLCIPVKSMSYTFLSSNCGLSRTSLQRKLDGLLADVNKTLSEYHGCFHSMDTNECVKNVN